VGADKVLQCRDCGNEFVFSAGEQEFYATRGFSEPTRCPDCRASRKAQREAGGSASGGYRETAGSGGGSYGGGRSSGGGYGRAGTGTRQMFKVVCADCGRETEVPFEPRNGRPVYCRDCFERRQARR
jgi:CxxC-x17-CxxC domain-containing protein